MKSIYDMMGRHTYPILREDAPLEHVERFFQVSAGEGPPEEEGGASARRAPSVRLPAPMGGATALPHPAG